MKTLWYEAMTLKTGIQHKKNIQTTLKSDLEYHDRILNEMNGFGFVSFYLYWYKHIWLILFN